MSKLKLLIIGFLTGIVDAVPGVSGATMLLVFGVYERTVSYASTVIYDQIPRSFSNIPKLELPKNKLEFNKTAYLLILLTGILIGLVFSFVVFDRLLHVSPSSVYGLFTGLILGSSYIVLNRNNEIKNRKNVKWVILGFSISVIIVFLSFTTGNSIPILFISGFIASFGMLLPGLSGSFLLLILGKYSFVSGLIASLVDNPSAVLSNTGLHLSIMGVGGVFGILVNLRLVSYLMDSNRVRTLSVILGLVVGGLLAPINEFMDLSDGNIMLFSVFFSVSLLTTLLIGYIKFKS